MGSNKQWLWVIGALIAWAVLDNIQKRNALLDQQYNANLDNAPTPLDDYYHQRYGY